MHKSILFAKNIITNFEEIWQSLRFDDLCKNASILSYYSMVGCVPVLTLFLATARGFGFQDIFQEQLLQLFSGQEMMIQQMFNFVDKYILQMRNGIFMGINFIFLFWSIRSFSSNIVECMNHMWSKDADKVIAKGNPFVYILVIESFPILMLMLSGLAVFLYNSLSISYLKFVLDPLCMLLLKWMPYIIMTLFFTVLYKTILNKSVSLRIALFSGFLASIAFQVFLKIFLYICMDNYTIIYDSFAVFPLFLLWFQGFWMICLSGVLLIGCLQEKRWNKYLQAA